MSVFFTIPSLFSTVTPGQFPVFFISSEERAAIKEHTSVPNSILSKIEKEFDLAHAIRDRVVRVKIYLSLREIDRILHHIAEKCNSKTAAENVQYHLDSAFGRLATIYNENIDQ